MRMVTSITTHPSKTQTVAAIIPAMNPVSTSSDLSLLVTMTKSYVTVVIKSPCAETVTISVKLYLNHLV